MASEEGHGSTVQPLFDKGKDISFCDNEKQTSLHIAGYLGYMYDSTMQLLISKDLMLVYWITTGKTPLIRARKKKENNSAANVNSCAVYKFKLFYSQWNWKLKH